jgi:hypothetical protein
MLDDRQYELEIIRQEERGDTEFATLVIALLAATGGAAFMLALVALLALFVVLNAPAAYLQTQQPAVAQVNTPTPTLPSPPTGEAFAPVVMITVTVTPGPAEVTPLATEYPTLAATETPTAPAPELPPADVTPYQVPTIAPPPAGSGELTIWLTQALGSSNRDAPRLAGAEQAQDVINVEWAINSALTNELLSQGARMDVVHMLSALQGNGVIFSTVNLTGTFPTLDASGNQVEAPAVNLTYTRDILDQINWADQQYVENQLAGTIFELAGNADLGPAFQAQ